MVGIDVDPVTSAAPLSVPSDSYHNAAGFQPCVQRRDRFSGSRRARGFPDGTVVIWHDTDKQGAERLNGVLFKITIPV